MIRRRIGALAAALFLAAAPAGAAFAAPPAWTHEASDVKPHPKATFGRLANGFRYVILPNAAPKGGASIRLRLDVGSLHEAEDERGLAHFLEHMAFAGSKNVPPGELFRSLERIGVKKGEGVNAFTSATQTFYNFDLPVANEANLDLSLKLLREIGELSLTDKAIDAERTTVLHEKRMREGPPMRLTEQQFEFWFKGRRAGDRLPIGTEAVIQNAPYAKIRGFYRRYYRPDRAVLVIVGDVDAKALEPKVRAAFETWQAQGPPGAEPELGAPTARKVQARVVAEAALPPRIMLTWIRPYERKPQTMASIRQMVLEYMGLAVLNRRLERLAAAANAPVTAAAVQREDALRSGRMTVLQASAPGDQRAALQALILAQRQLLTHGISDAELKVELAAWRARLENRAFGTLTEPSGRLADEIVQTLEEHGVFTSAEQDLVIFDQVTKGLTTAEVMAELRASFGGEGPLVLLVTPQEVPESQVVAAVVEAQSRAVSAPVMAAQAWPYTDFGARGRVASRKHVADLDATLIGFENGVRLTVKPTKFRTGQVLVGVRVGRGRLALPADKPSPEWATMAYVLGGLKKLSFEDLQPSLPGRMITVNPSLSDDALRLDGATRAEDLEAQLQVLAAYVSDPGWRPEAFERVRTQLTVNMSRTDGTPGGVMQRQVRTLLRGGDRRWATPSPWEVTGARLEDVQGALASSLAGGPIEVTIVGDVDLEAAIAQVGKTFGALPRRAAAPPATASAPKFPEATPKPVVLRHVGPQNQSWALAAWPIPDFFADPKEARTLRVLEQVIALRLFDRLRDTQQLAYATETELVSSEALPYGYLMALAEVKPQDGEKVLAAMADIAADLKANELSPDELERARRPRIEEYAAGQQTNAYWLANLSGVHDDPRRLDMPRTVMGQLQSVDAAAIRAAAQRHLRDDRLWQAQILPLEQPAVSAAMPPSGS